MEEKHNNATPQRPEGARPLDANLIPINIEKFVTQIKNEEAYDKNGKNAITVFKSENITITIVALKANEVIHPGNAENCAIMTLQVLEGEILFISADNEIKLESKNLLTIHQKLSFNATAKTDTICLLTVVR
ncbi:MAG: hypothetical protein EOO87_09405 [Pedobacter sp.]|nr:MAG: hypothetical protein EOO87_09405 [Pedobacter sp.]